MPLHKWLYKFLYRKFITVLSVDFHYSKATESISSHGWATWRFYKFKLAKTSLTFTRCYARPAEPPRLPRLWPGHFSCICKQLKYWQWAITFSYTNKNDYQSLTISFHLLNLSRLNHCHIIYNHNQTCNVSHHAVEVSVEASCCCCCYYLSNNFGWTTPTKALKLS